MLSGILVSDTSKLSSNCVLWFDLKLMLNELLFGASIDGWRKAWLLLGYAARILSI